MKKLTVLLTVVLFLTTVLSACGTSSSSESSQATNGESSKSSQATKGEPYTVRYAFMVVGVPEDMQEIQDAMSKISEEKINVKLELLPINASQYSQQITLMTSSGEKLDLMTERGANYSIDVSKNQLIQIDELLKKYGQGALKAVGDFMKAPVINGKTYAVPTVRDFAASYGLVMRKDILDKYKIDAKTIKTYDDMSAMFKTIQAGEPNMVMTMSQSQALSVYFGLCQSSDKLGDDFGVLLNAGNELKVQNLFKSKEYAQNLKLIRDWYNKGYILKDNPTNAQAGAALVKSGKAFSYVSNLKPGFEQQASNLCGTQMVTAEINPAFTNTSLVSQFMMAIPANCENPDKAMQLLNLFYSDPDFINTIDWGIEGKHYVKTDVNNVIDYPQGVNASNTGYGLNMGYQFGNQLSSYVWKGDSPDLYTRLNNFNKSAKHSKALGFTFDSSSVKTEVAALSNVCNQYRVALEDGLLDPDENLPKFISALESAGIDKVIAEKQKQLDAWAKTQGK